MHVDALIWVTLVVCWAGYLIPKALMSHDAASRSRSVDRFSHTLRVLARREPVNRRTAALVVPSSKPASASAGHADSSGVIAEPVTGPSPVEIRARRESARRATRRRRRVLSLILLSVATVAGVAAFGLIDWVYVAAPAGLLACWLVACRVMVRGEARSWRRLVDPQPGADSDLDEAEQSNEVTVTIDTASIAHSMTDPAMWDPVPVTLPTYVTKATAAPRTVRTIDLDSTGVWTSGHTAADSALAREADEAARAVRDEGDEAGDRHEAVGS